MEDLPDVPVGVGEAVPVHRALGHLGQPGRAARGRSRCSTRRSTSAGDSALRQAIDVGPSRGSPTEPVTKSANRSRVRSMTTIVSETTMAATWSSEYASFTRKPRAV